MRVVPVSKVPGADPARTGVGRESVVCKTRGLRGGVVSERSWWGDSRFVEGLRLGR